MRLRRHDQALARAQEALAMLQRLAHHPLDAEAVVRASLGEVLQHLGRNQDAVGELERAVELTEKTAGPDDHELPAQLGALGTSYLAVDRPVDALAAFHRGRTLAEKAFGPTSQDAAELSAGEATALDDLHRPREAIPLAEHVLAVAPAAHLPPLEVAHAQLALGRALLATGDRARGRKLLSGARAAFAAGGDAQDVAAVDQLLGDAGRQSPSR